MELPLMALIEQEFDLQRIEDVASSVTHRSLNIVNGWNELELDSAGNIKDPF